MKIYLAARFARAQELRAYRVELNLRGHRVTSRWLDAPQGTLGEVDLAMAAAIDLADIRAAELLVQFTEKPDDAIQRNTGGRHVELGYAYARGIPVWIIGPPENVFHHVMPTRRFASWPDFSNAIAGGEPF